MDRPKEPILSSSLVARAARVGIVAWAGIGLAVLLYILGRYVLYPIRVIFPPLLVALVIVYLLNPIVSFLERKGIRRGWATLLTYVVVLSAVGVGLAYLIPVLTNQVTRFTDNIGELLDNARKQLVDAARGLGFHVRPGDLFASFQQGGGANEFIGRVLSIGAGVIHIALILILGPVLAFYLLVDLPKLRQGIEAAVPARRRAEVRSIGQKLSTALGGYFRGQLLVATFVGLASMAGLFIVGLPYWAPVGLVAGLFNLVPLIGPFIGAVPAIFIAFTTPTSGNGLLHPDPGWPLAIAAAVALTVVQQIDNHIISPNVMRRTVKLHPLTVMLSLLAAGTIAGLWGMLLVIPLVASVKILVLHYWDTRMTWPPDEPVAPGSAAEEARVAEDAGAAREPLEEAPVPATASPDGGAPDVKPRTPADAIRETEGADTAPGTEGQTGGWWFRLRFWRKPKAGESEREQSAPAAQKGS